MEQIENHMVVDACWEELEKNYREEGEDEEYGEEV